MNKTAVPVRIKSVLPGAGGVFFSPKNLGAALEKLHIHEVPGAPAFANKHMMNVVGKQVQARKPMLKEITENRQIFDRAMAEGAVGIPEDTPRWMVRHELTHYLAHKKGRWYTNANNPLTRTVSEFNANMGGLKRSKVNSVVPRALLAGAITGVQEVATHPVSSSTIIGGTGYGVYRLHKKGKVQKTASLNKEIATLLSKAREATALKAAQANLASKMNSPAVKKVLSMSKQGTLSDKVNYGWYVTKHKASIVSPMMQMGLPLTQALKHDLSKYTPSEFGPYSNWFNSPKGLKGTRDPEAHKEWRKAVDLHYSRNPHHWKKRGQEWQTTPLKYREESVADWYSVGKTNRPKGTKFPSFKQWYAEREKGLPIDPVAKADISKQLGLSKSAYVMEKVAWAIGEIS